MSFPYFAASAIAASALAWSLTMLTPTLDPSRGGFTTKGAGNDGSFGPAETSMISARGVGTPAATKAALARFLSKAMRLLAHAGAGVGDAHVLEDLLELAVLAEGAVDHVEREAGAGGRSMVGAGDVHRHGIQAEALERLEHGVSGGQRDLPLGTGAAHQDCDFGGG